MDVHQNLIESINECLALKELTPTDFARLVGCQERCVAKWRQGKNMPSLKYLILIADALQYSTDYLCGLTDDSSFIPALTPTTFSNRLNKLIEEKNVSKNQIAKICNISSSTLSKYLLHGQLPKPDNIYALAEYFGCTMDYLIGRADYR